MYSCIQSDRDHNFAGKQTFAVAEKSRTSLGMKGLILKVRSN